MMEQDESTGKDAVTDAAGGIYRRIDGRAEFQACVVDIVKRAADAASFEMTWCVADFETWPLGDPTLLEALVRWGKPHRRLLLLALDFDAVPRLHPAFARWRRQWSHVVECRALCDVAPSAVRSMVLVPRLTSLKLADSSRCVGVESSIPADMNRARESIDAVSQRSIPAFPATVLGL